MVITPLLVSIATFVSFSCADVPSAHMPHSKAANSILFIMTLLGLVVVFIGIRMKNGSV